MCGVCYEAIFLNYNKFEITSSGFRWDRDDSTPFKTTPFHISLPVEGQAVKH
ncbi:MAG: hypothetical protein O6940_07775 [Ignavibacteria bacterium]|nr:hypothetical protein [Ignavibacteria bacterium]